MNCYLDVIAFVHLEGADKVGEAGDLCERVDGVRARDFDDYGFRGGDAVRDDHGLEFKVGAVGDCQVGGILPACLHGAGEQVEPAVQRDCVQSDFEAVLLSGCHVGIGFYADIDLGENA